MKYITLVLIILLGGCSLAQTKEAKAPQFEREIDTLYRVGCEVETYYRNDRRGEVQIKCKKGISE